MTNQTVTVAPGGAALLNSNIVAGSTIYNQDSKNAVWVSSHPDVTPGYGIPVQPLGTASWAGGTLYAIVDAGVVTPVTLSLSSDVLSTDNPIAVGAAVAAKLLAQGIPNVFQGGSPPVVATSATSITYDVSAYGSMTLSLNSDVAQTWTLAHMGTVFGTAHVEQYVTQQPTLSGSFIVNNPYIDVTVRSPLLRVSWSAFTATTTVNIYGSNRLFPEMTFKNRQPFIGNLNGVAFTSGTRVNIPGTFVSQGGQFFLRLQASGTLQGFLGFNYLDANGAAIQFDMVDTKTGIVGSIGQETEKLIQLPPGIYTLYFNPQVSTTATVNCNIIPA